MGQEKKVILRFAEGAAESQHDRPIRRGGIESATVKGFAAGIEEIRNWFEKFQIESIELWISGGIETGGILELFVSAKGEGGMRVVLKPQ